MLLTEAPDILKYDKFGKKYVTTKKQEVDIVDWDQLNNDIKMELVLVELVERLYQITKSFVLNTDVK